MFTLEEDDITNAFQSIIHNGLKNKDKTKRHMNLTFPGKILLVQQ